MTKFISLFCLPILLFTSVASAQSVDLHWSQDGLRCWYKADSNYHIVDVKTKECSPAFNRQKVAKTLAHTLNQEFSVESLKIESIDFTPDQNELLLKIRGRMWLLTKGEEYRVKASTQEASGRSNQLLFLPPQKSKSRGDSTEITIHNQLEEPIDLFWVMSSGERRFYQTIDANQQHQQHTFVGHAWVLRKKSGEELGAFFASLNGSWKINQAALQSARRDSQPKPRPASRQRESSPDGKWTAFVRDHNLWIRDGDNEMKLSSKATVKNSFQRNNRENPDVRWSPDSKFLVAFQTQSVTDREVHFIESSPRDQLQPKLISHSYRKPGDDLPKTSVRFFDVQSNTEIPVSDELFATPWSLSLRKWSEDSDRFWLRYNQRGHQVVRELEVSTNGSVKPFIEEKSETFIHYSGRGKSVYEELGNNEILWASERSGWNHLYRYSLSTGNLINPVTSGEWNVKRIEKIDRQAKQVWFYAVGVHKDQDPYHEHFCRVNFDGTGFIVLTQGDGTHQIEFKQDGQFFVDTYSRVDMAPVTELRESQSGSLICELHREDTKTRFGERRLTERFVAKGRDGHTDIWGIIHWPLDFDSQKKYPVVENIYAGPHDHHVPKAFRTSYRHQYQIADAGHIVVQIDGMGTAWRSKGFHDLCYKNLRDAGFPDRIAWMKAAAEKYPQMDITRVGIYGGSAGGQNAMAALLWHHDFYKVAVADCGCHDNRMDKIWWNEQWMGWPIDESYIANSNMENAQLLKGKLMLLVGELDRNVDPASTTQVVHQLIKHNKEFEFVLVTGTGHGSAETPWASRKRLNFLREHLARDPN